MGINRKKFGASLSNERKRLGLKASQMAEYCGVKTASQYLYEKGDRLPNADYIDRAIELGVAGELLLPSLRKSTHFSIAEIVRATQLTDAQLSEERITLLQNFLNNSRDQDREAANE